MSTFVRRRPPISSALAALLLAVLVLSACSARSRRGVPLARGESAQAAAIDLGRPKILTRNRLAYHLALAPRALVSVELGTHFELVIRGRPDRKDRVPTRRIYLDTPTYDVLDLALSADGESAFVASAAGWVRHYSLADGDLKSEWRTGSAATALALSEGDEYLVIGSDRGTLCLRRLRDGALLQCMIAHEARIGALAVHGDVLASASWRGGLALWSLPALARLDHTTGTGSIAALAFAPDGQTLAVARNQRPPQRSQAISDREAESPNIAAPGENQIELWHVAKGRLGPAPIQRLLGHRSLVSDLCLSASDLVSVSWDRSVRLWNRGSARETRKFTGFQHLVASIAMTANGGAVAVASWATGADGPAITWLPLLFPAGGSR